MTFITAVHRFTITVIDIYSDAFYAMEIFSEHYTSPLLSQAII